MNKKIPVLHVMHVLPEKHNDRFIEFAMKELTEFEHHFLPYKRKSLKSDAKVVSLPELRLLRYPAIFLTLLRFSGSPIVFHGLNLNFWGMIFYSFTFRISNVAKRAVWVIWGGDLYTYKTKNKNVHTKIFHILKKFCFIKLSYVASQIPKDIELAKLHFCNKAKSLDIGYPMLGKSIQNTTRSFKNRGTILVGNSADPGNNHGEVFEQLGKIEGDFIVFCPLTYGNDAYRDSVISLGREIFGNRFHPLVETVCLDDYLKLLETVDVAIFNFRRQQGLGNIIPLLQANKKVYLNKDNPLLQHFSDLNIPIYDKDTIVGSTTSDEIFSFPRIDISADIEALFGEQSLSERWKIALRSIAKASS
jgi:hypothetical protein